MTKAEAWVSGKTLRSVTNPSEPFWMRIEGTRMDHKSQAMSFANIYHRRTFDDAGLVLDTHRLVCFSHHGDSILWVNIKGEINENPHDPIWVGNQSPWELYNCRHLPYGANNEGNIEFAYDHVLPLIHPEV